MANNILEMKNISKQFPGVLALDDVSLDLRAGEVLALVGENGAGKSTLLKVLSGAISSDKGSIYLNGKKIDNFTPQDALDLGISIIYQELDNYRTLSIAENILVNNLPRKGSKKRGRVDWKATFKEAKHAVEKITNEIDVRATMSTLSSAKQQIVEIAKAMNKKMCILVMDEPTSALNRVETEQLLTLVRSIADSGVGVIYISHRMDEIFSISDRIQVMRDGKNVATLVTSETNRDQVIGHMVGRTLDKMYPHIENQRGDVILDVKGVFSGKARDISFKLYAGEVLGLFGLMGAGRTDIARALFGDLYIREGEIYIMGEKAKYDSPIGAINHGIAYVPSERKLEGLMLKQSVKFNICISSINRLMRKFKLDTKGEGEMSKNWIKKLNIKTPSEKASCESLSGGNQQKVVLGKWLEMTPKILILNDPTRGIDVGAKFEIYSLMEELCAKGIGIIMISSELEETIAMSDRVLVVCEGKITGEIYRSDATQETLMKCAVGGIM